MFGGTSYGGAFSTGQGVAPVLDTDYKGQTDLAFTDILGRTVTSIHFPFRPGVQLVVGGQTMTTAEERSSGEQSLVSGWFNTNGPFTVQAGHGDMHASHAAKHALCGSSYRTNFHPVSASCNTGTIKGFESPLEAAVDRCYGPLGRAFDITAAPEVLVQITYTEFNIEKSLPYLAGSEAATVFRHQKTNIAYGILCSLAATLPSMQVRELWSGTLDIASPGGRKWAKTLELKLQIADIMLNAGRPDKPRYSVERSSIDRVTQKWYDSGCPLVGNIAFALNVELEKIATNSTMFNFLANLSGLSASTLWREIENNTTGLGGLKNCVQELANVDATATLSLPKFNGKEGKIKRMFEIYEGAKAMGAADKNMAWNWLKGEAGSDAEALRRWTDLYFKKVWPEGPPV